MKEGWIATTSIERQRKEGENHNGSLFFLCSPLARKGSNDTDVMVATDATKKNNLVNSVLEPRRLLGRSCLKIPCTIRTRTDLKRSSVDSKQLVSEHFNLRDARIVSIKERMASFHRVSEAFPRLRDERDQLRIVRSSSKVLHRARGRERRAECFP